MWAMVEYERHPGYYFPRLPGTYVLVCRLESQREIVIGRLGSFVFEAGLYFYVGSALGPGGLAARLRRHLNRDRRFRHWHIDYLTEQSTIEQVWYCQSEHRYEHEWARLLFQFENLHIPVSRFGASDCRCPAHLFFFDGQQLPVLNEIQSRWLRAGSPDSILVKLQ